MQWYLVTMYCAHYSSYGTRLKSQDIIKLLIHIDMNIIQNVISIHPVVVNIFQSGPKCGQIEPNH